MLDLDRHSAFDPASAAEFLAALPSEPAVLLIEPRPELPGARPLLLRTADLRRRLTLLLGPRDPASKRVNLREYAAGIRYRLTGSPFEQALVQWQHARALVAARLSRKIAPPRACAGEAGPGQCVPARLRHPPHRGPRCV